MAIDRQTRARILFLAGRGESPQQIAAQVECSLSTVRRWISTYERTSALECARIPGRPRCTTAQIDARIASLASSDNTVTALTVHKLLQDDAPSKRTILRRISSAGLVLRTMRQREEALWQASTQEKRRVWAGGVVRDWEGWYEETVYVDESIFASNPNHKKRYWRPKNIRGRDTQWVRNSGRISVGCFGGLCGDELLPLYIINKGFDQWQYIDFLQELYYPVLQEKFGSTPFLYLQDNAPAHRSLAVRSWVSEQSGLKEAWSYLPSYSPDLNPIENVWARMKRMLAPHIYRTSPTLTQAILEAWNTIGQDKQFLRSLTSSMVRRLDAVEEAEGEPTRY